MSKEIDSSEYYDFLEDLRDSGVTNMWGARPYLSQAFPELSLQEAGKILSDWIKSFKN